MFSSLSVWEDGEMREQQGAWPVIFLSFAGVKAARFSEARAAICQLLTELYSDFEFLCGEDGITEKDKAFFDRVDYDMADNIAAASLRQLSRMMEKVYGKKAIIFLDEYDTPLKESYSGVIF